MDSRTLQDIRMKLSEEQMKDLNVIFMRLQAAEDQCIRSRVTIQGLEDEIQHLREDLGSLRVLEAFLRSGIAKDLKLSEDVETQAVLREFFRRNLLRALKRPETLLLVPDRRTQENRVE